jgi:glycosyltransferase involved in cell wall biosynthesis
VIPETPVVVIESHDSGLNCLDGKEINMKVNKTLSFQSDILPSNPVLASKMVSRPEFLGDFDENRLIGGFSGRLTDGDKLALQNFMANEFGLEHFSVVRSLAGAQELIEENEKNCSRIDLLSFDIAALRDCGPLLVARLLDLLSTKGIVCVESDEKTDEVDIDVLPDGVLEPVMASPGFAVFAQVGAERSPLSLRYQIDLFWRRRYVHREHQRKLSVEPKVPEVAVFVLTYKHEDFIAECLRSIMMQRGQFTLRVLIIDDASPDNNAHVARSVIAENCSEHIKFELRVNPQNAGASNNWGPALSWAQGADYFSPIDGDDFWDSEDRIQEHIDFMREHPDVLISFNSFEFCSDDSSKRRDGIRVDHTIVSANRIVRDNPVGHLGSTFYRGELVEVFPLEPFYYTNGDWKINVYCSQIGAVGYLDKALSVYRMHAGGVWSLMAGVQRLIPTIDAISKYNTFTDFSYSDAYSSLILENLIALGRIVWHPSDDFQRFDLVIMHNDCPSQDDFHYSELTYYLKELPSSVLLAPMGRNYQRKYPELGSRVIDDDDRFPIHLAKQIYITTLDFAYSSLRRVNDAGVPFVFTLCPNGGFVLSSAEVDRKLRKLCSSPFFQGVIVTERVIYEYVLANALCPHDKMHLIQGRQISTVSQATPTGKRRWGYDKDHLDICFFARQYSPLVSDVNYEMLTEIADMLHSRHESIRFHVVGVRNPCAIKGFLPGNWMKFYPDLSEDKFDGFFKEMDIILPSLVSRDTMVGIVDNFPEDHCVIAGACGVAVFTTDDFNASESRYTNGDDLIIVNHDVQDIVGKIEYYYRNPEKLKSIGEKGAKTFVDLHGITAQMEPRVKVLRDALQSPHPTLEMRALMRMQIASMNDEYEIRLAEELRRFADLLSDRGIAQTIMDEQKADLETLRSRFDNLLKDRGIAQTIMDEQKVEIERLSILLENERRVPTGLRGKIASLLRKN